MKRYDAFVWTKDPESVAKRVTVWAETSAEAMRLLKAEHGEDAIISVRNKEDAERPR